MTKDVCPYSYKKRDVPVTFLSLTSKFAKKLFRNQNVTSNIMNKATT